MTRGALAGLGLAATAYGGWLLLQRPGDLVGVAVWLGGGVLLHDLVLVPLTLAVCWLATRLLPDWLRAPATAGLVVLGSVTLLAIPVLGRFGARSDNPTLLDRDYLAGWLGLAGLTLAAVLAGGLLRRRRVRRHGATRAGR